MSLQACKPFMRHSGAQRHAGAVGAGIIVLGQNFTQCRLLLHTCYLLVLPGPAKGRKPAARTPLAVAPAVAASLPALLPGRVSFSRSLSLSGFSFWCEAGKASSANSSSSGTAAWSCLFLSLSLSLSLGFLSGVAPVLRKLFARKTQEGLEFLSNGTERA